MSALDGHIDFPQNTAPTVQSIDAKINAEEVTLYLRFPLSHSVTIFGAFSFIKNERSNGRNRIEFGKNSASEGNGLRFGARYYFNR